MKKNLFTLGLFLTINAGFAQDGFSDKSFPEIKKEKLLKAKLISELIPNCPSHWSDIINYELIDLMAICNGKILEEESVDENLTTKQKNILNSIDKGSELVVKIKYRWKDAASAQGDYGKMHEMKFKVLVSPETEAERAQASADFLKSINYQVHGKYFSPIKNEKLNKASSITDFIPNYSSLWIKGYVSVEILTSCNGKIKKATSANEILTDEQKKIISNLEPGTDVFVNAFYQYKNVITGEIETAPRHYSATVVPETEAEYLGGYTELTNYLLDNAINKIPLLDAKTFVASTVRFMVSESGEILKAKVSKTSGDSKLDNLLLEAIIKMPKWKPAQNSKGEKIKQEFEFSVGRNVGQGC